MDAKLTTRYRHWRSFGHGAQFALLLAREEAAMKALRARLDWDFGYRGDGTFAHADLEGLPDDALTVRVKVGDDELDWGDIEPTDEEREHASAYFVVVEVLDADGEEVCSDSIGGVDVIDLPGYLGRDWEDAVAMALREYLLDEAVRVATREPAEAAYWATRDVETA